MQELFQPDPGLEPTDALLDQGARELTVVKSASRREPFDRDAADLLARCLQHETDHLRGLLYIDHLPRNRRRRVLREMEPFDWNDTGAGSATLRGRE